MIKINLAEEIAAHSTNNTQIEQAYEWTCAPAVYRAALARCRAWNRTPAGPVHGLQYAYQLEFLINDEEKHHAS